MPRANALTSEHTISGSRSSQARLCEKNSNSSTLSVRVGDFRDLLSTFTVINGSYAIPGPIRCPVLV
jgi:hypothetical protein